MFPNFRNIANTLVQKFAAKTSVTQCSRALKTFHPKDVLTRREIGVVTQSKHALNTFHPKDVLTRNEIGVVTQCRRALNTFDAKDVLTSREIGVYRKLFDKMDSNHDGLLTREDLKKGLKDFVNYSASEQELNETMETLDADKDGNVGFDEFIGYVAWSRQVRVDETIRAAFERFDKNDDGLIDRDELREALISLGLAPSEALLNNIMLLSDKDDDGKINLNDFRTVFYKQGPTDL